MSATPATGDGLPETDPEFVSEMQAEFDSIFQTGSAAEVDNARFRLAWALVHSPVANHQLRGLDVCRNKLAGSTTGAERKELYYFQAVALYKLRRFVEARRVTRTLLKDYPEFRQAGALQGMVENAMVSEGLWVLGAGAAVVAGVALLVGAARR